MSSERRRGQVVIFLGPDGAGKSTLLRLVESQLSARGEDFRTHYFAPGFLKRYRPKDVASVTTNPHEGRQYSGPVVAAKVALMVFEFRIGLAQARRRNNILLFDRFIHDVLVDPMRYRMERVRWWMRAVLWLAPRPDLAVIVTAPADLIQSRKKEVPEAETARQVEAYRAAAGLFPAILAIENTGAPEEVADRILARILAG